MIPGIWMILIKATYKNETIYHVTKTGHIKARHLTSPALDIPHRLSDDYIHHNALRSALQSKSWPINECTFECWTYGPIELREGYKDLSWEHLNRVVVVATYQAEYRLAAEGHDVVMIHKPITLDNEDFESFAHQLSSNFLAKTSTAYLIP